MAVESNCLYFPNNQLEAGIIVPEESEAICRYFQFYLHSGVKYNQHANFPPPPIQVLVCHTMLKESVTDMQET